MVDDRLDRGRGGITALVVSSSLNELFGDEERRDDLGGELALASDRPPGHLLRQVERAPRPPRVAELVRSVTSRIRAASVRTAFQRLRVQREEGRASLAALRSGRASVEERLALRVGASSGRTPCRSGATLSSKARQLLGEIAIARVGRVVVLRGDGRARGLLRLRGQDRVGVGQRPRRLDVARGESPAWSVERAAQRSTARIAVIARIERRRPPIARRTQVAACSASDAASADGSAAGQSLPAGRRRRPARRLRRPATLTTPAVGAAAGPRRQPAMTLPMSRGDAAPVAAIASATRASQLGVAQLAAGRKSREDRDLGLLLGREVLAAARSEGLDRLAAGLDLAREDGQRPRRRSVGPAVALLGVVDGGLGHPQGVAAQRVTRPHRGGRSRPGVVREGSPVRHLGGGCPRRTPSRRRASGGRGRRSATQPWRRSRVLLALRFLALALHARLLVVLAAASLGEDAALLDLLVEAAQGALEGLVLTDSDFCQSRIHLLGLDSCRPPARHDPATAPVPAERRCGPLAGPPECTPASRSCHETVGRPAAVIEPVGGRPTGPRSSP